jgi:Ca2+-binding RTX toxin-like protein
VRGRFWHTDFAAMRQARSTQTQTQVLELLVYVDGTEVVFNDLVNPGGGDRSDLRFGLGEAGEIFVLNKWDRTIRRLLATAPLTCKGKVATIVGSAAGELIRGTSGDDVIVALGGDDTVLAGAGDDTVCGGLGGDIIRGGAGDDILSGDGGNDTIRGNSGDACNGGSGIDKSSRCERNRKVEKRR